LLLATLVVLSYKLPNYYKNSASHRTLCTLYRVSSVDTSKLAYVSSVNITISQSLDYQSTAPSRLCPLICKSITIARIQDFSPSPSVLCLQPARRLCCCTMLFLPSKSRVLDPATRSSSLPPVFSTILTVATITRLPLRCKYTRTAIATLSRCAVPLLLAVLLITTRACSSEKRIRVANNTLEPSQSPVPAYPPACCRSNKKVPPSIQA
jgi:hypothetical protein